MPTAEKSTAVAELATAFRESAGAVLTEYRGLTVAQLSQLRRSLGGDARYAVVKNTLTRLAAREAGVTQVEAFLEGPSAIAFVTGDPVAVARGIRDFARTNPALVVKGGVLEGRALSADDIRRLADLESREALLAKLAGAAQASLAQAAGLFAAPLAQAARALAALMQKLPATDGGPEATEEAVSADAGTADTPPTDPPGPVGEAGQAPAAVADDAPASNAATDAEAATTEDAAVAAETLAADETATLDEAAAAAETADSDETATPAAAADGAASTGETTATAETANSAAAPAADEAAIGHPAEPEAGENSAEPADATQDETGQMTTEGTP